MSRTGWLRQLPRGHYSGPRVEIIDKRGDVLYVLCWGCESRILPWSRTCPSCGRVLLGTEQRMGR